MFKREGGRLQHGASFVILAQAAAMVMLVLGAAADAPPARGVQYAQVTVRQQIIVRMPQRGPAAAGGGPVVQWREGRGPRCVPARAVVGASALGRNSVDLMMRDRSRVRIRLDRNCPGLDFYRGFYVAGTEDGMICADRDSLRSRMGGQCEIDQFRSLTAVRP